MLPSEHLRPTTHYNRYCYLIQGNKAAVAVPVARIAGVTTCCPGWAPDGYPCNRSLPFSFDSHCVQQYTQIDVVILFRATQLHLLSLWLELQG
jgi:hypothetical protein